MIRPFQAASKRSTNSVEKQRAPFSKVILYPLLVLSTSSSVPSEHVSVPKTISFRQQNRRFFIFFKDFPSLLFSIRKPVRLRLYSLKSGGKQKIWSLF